MGKGSYARQKSELYEKVEKQLDEKIIEIQGQLADAETALTTDYNILSTGGEAEGMLKWRYDDHLDIWQGKYQRVLNKMQNGLTSVRNRKIAAGQLKEYWLMKAEAEEMMENAGF